jgi:RNA polymerase sigma-70 factor, ECF subfamily
MASFILASVRLEKSVETHENITRMLGELRAGRREVESRLLEAVYPELRRIAAHYMQGERAGHTLQPTALVNEAYLELVGPDIDWRNRSHFFGVAAQLMRRILVSYARRKKAQKREGKRQRVELSDTVAITEDRLDEIIAVDDALDRLAEWDPRQAKIVELRFFAGLTEDETAEALGISPRTVKRDWMIARAWLHSQLNPKS